jgi:hypothetical protein
MNKNNRQNISDATSVLIKEGIKARQELEMCLKTIESLKHYIECNRYDRNEVYEAEEDLRECEARAERLSEIIKNADAAKKNKLMELRDAENEILDRMEFYLRKLDACNIDMYDSRFTDVDSSYDIYNEEYNRLYQESVDIAIKIAKIQNTK